MIVAKGSNAVRTSFSAYHWQTLFKFVAIANLLDTVYTSLRAYKYLGDATLTHYATQAVQPAKTFCYKFAAKESNRSAA